MANAIADWHPRGRHEVDVLNIADTPADAVKYARSLSAARQWVLGFSRKTEFDPFFTELESKISGLKVALFGSWLGRRPVDA